MTNKSNPVKSPASDLADILIENIAEQNKKSVYQIEKALVKSGRKKSVETDLNNPFNRPKESKLYFSLRGFVKYQSISGKSYETKLQPRTLQYKLLHIFVANPKQLISEDSLAKSLNSDQSNIRHLVNDIRKRLSLNNKNQDNFLISNRNKRYGISCISEIRE